MKSITLAFINGQDVPQGFLSVLYDLSPMKNQDGGFSFVVPLSYLESYEEDCQADEKNGFPTPWNRHVLELIRNLRGDGRKALFVCLDKEFTNGA